MVKFSKCFSACFDRMRRESHVSCSLAIVKVDVRSWIDWSWVTICLSCTKLGKSLRIEPITSDKKFLWHPSPQSLSRSLACWELRQCSETSVISGSPASALQCPNQPRHIKTFLCLNIISSVFCLNLMCLYIKLYNKDVMYSIYCVHVSRLDGYLMRQLKNRHYKAVFICMTQLQTLKHVRQTA